MLLFDTSCGQYNTFGALLDLDRNIRTRISFLAITSCTSHPPCTTKMSSPMKFLKKTSSANGVISGPTVDVPKIVRDMIDDIRSNGDAAVYKYSEKFDKWTPKSFRLSQPEIDSIISKVSKTTLEDIKTVQDNVRIFALAQRETIQDLEMEIRPGVFLGHKNIPVGSVGA